MRKALIVAVAVSALAVQPAFTAGDESSTEPESPAGKAKCDQRCHDKRDRGKLRRLTTRHPIPDYIVACESGGNYRAINSSGSGAGGKYQIMPGTWTANLPRRRFVRLAEGLTPRQARRREKRGRALDAGPRWSSPLLQDKVAAIIYAAQGPDPWSCG